MLDDDDKVRRNFVVACALIIAAWWFDVSAATIINKFTTVDLKEAQPLKAWVAVVVMLAYLTWRYVFCKDTLTRWREGVGVLLTGAERQVVGIIDRHARQWFEARRDSPIFTPVAISTYATSWIKTSPNAHRAEGLPIHKIKVGIVRLPSTFWAGQVLLELALDEPGMAPVEIGLEAGPLRYRIPWRYRGWLYCRAMITEIALSERLPLWIVPGALGLFAWLITITKTCSAALAAAGLRAGTSEVPWWSGGL